jgi:hypothetical protein
MITFVAMWILFWCIVLTGAVEMVETEPKQRWWFNTLDWTLCPIMKLLFHKKISLGYHWIIWKGKLTFGDSLFGNSLTVHVNGDESLPKITSVWKQIWAEFKGKGQVLLDLNNLDSRLRKHKYWRLGFYDPKTKVSKLCIIKIPILEFPLSQTLLLLKGMVRCYVWGDDVIFFGIDPDGQQLPITRLWRGDPKDYSDVPLH